MNSKPETSNIKNNMISNAVAISKQIKLNMLKTIDCSKTGHLGACCSSNELMCTLYFTDILNYDLVNPRHPDRDYVLVRGHVGPLRYNIFTLLLFFITKKIYFYPKT